jgi:hypothetical protein
MALSLPGPMPPKNLKFGFPEATELAVARYIAAAVLGGRAAPGRRSTMMCEKGLVVGRAKRRVVGDGVEVGSVMRGWPAGMRPKVGVAIAKAVFDNC